MRETTLHTAQPGDETVGTRGPDNCMVAAPSFPSDVLIGPGRHESPSNERVEKLQGTSMNGELWTLALTGVLDGQSSYQSNPCR